MSDAMPQQDPGQFPSHGRTLRPAARPTGGNPDPADAPFALERMSRLGHDLNNLLDGSMRCLSLARRALCGDASGDTQIDDARRRVEVAYTALERMADLVHAAMKGSASVVGSPNLSPTGRLRWRMRFRTRRMSSAPRPRSVGLAFRSRSLPRLLRPRQDPFTP
jgi:hypothetical protein